ncbi:Ankyrin repeat and mynd domain-containing protein 2-like [Mycena venus]|uniref:Ankyrin repeat and mynd domain-containing protein 2-like n=1 Tax=Mycena venus TaxID=2733690 RepID=A0A8H6Y4F7_9AGAR|nr:Ankyrin repeat and mynd domain-containing protein 2-like [Mycena venus]
MPPRKPSTAEEIARLAAQMRVADPNVDNGAFSSLTTNDAMNWIMGIGHINEIDPRMKTAANPKEQREIATENLRLALWDIQRFEYLFPDKTYSKVPNFKLARLESWPNWKKPHPEVRAGGMGAQKFDGYKDAQRMQSYIMTHFNLLAFTQPEMVQNLPMSPPQGPAGNWIGVKKIMGHAALDLTAEGGQETPFVVYFDKDIMLIMEILDVKRAPWPEPGPKFLEQLKEAQETKFGARPGAPLVPMMQTPKIPLVVVRYSYMEGRPEGGAQFLTHLEARLREVLPAKMSDDDVRVELEKHLKAGEEMPEAHIRMFARLLSYNADLLDKEWVADQQSHWNISKEAKEETRVSFFVPCLRPRFDVVEEIETGKEVILYNECGNCKKPAKTMCSSCRAVSYCNTDCAKAQWPTHKLVCKISKKIAADPSALPEDTLYVPARAYIHWVADFGFASEQEAVKMGGPPVDEPPRNQYGGERFMCRAILANAGKGPGGGTAFLYDRRRSVIIRVGPQEAGKARVHGVEIPFHAAGYRQFAEVVRERGVQGQLLYVWVRRVGDCIEVE